MANSNTTKKTVTVACLQDVLAFPPVINLLEVLLNNNHKVNFVSYNVLKLPKLILDNPNFYFVDIPMVNGRGIINKFKRGTTRNKIGRAAVAKFMENSDILWTTTDLTCRSLGKMQFNYKHVMQLMELKKWYPYIKGLSYPKFPIDRYAQKAFKVVVPEENRAYIQKTLWNLPKTPSVLPNKNYMVNPGEVPENMNSALQSMKDEKRRIILYIGIIMPERNLETYAKAIEKVKDKYSFYVAGPIRENCLSYYKQLFKQYECIHYLGNYPAPKHLHLLKYADIGLLCYKPGKADFPLNVLYCAPNKIFEYSGASLPMIGSDVIGLKYQFEKFNMGVCVDESSSDSIVKALDKIDENYTQMSENSRKFYLNTDLDKIVEDIVEN